MSIEPGDRFQTTHWSVVLNAGAGTNESAAGALDALCRHYWYPLYAYARRRGQTPDAAADLTQAFFLRFVERQLWQAADPEKGRFRSFLLRSFQNFVTNQWQQQQAEVRGGGKAVLQIDFAEGEDRFRTTTQAELTAEQCFQQQWAMTLLTHATNVLREEYQGRDKSKLFEVLEPFISPSEQSGSYANAARQLEMTEGAVRVAVHRLRRQFGDTLRQVISETVQSPGEIDEEIRDLFGAFS